MEEFSELIKRRRKDKKLTMRELEATLKENGINNISSSYVYLMENGKKSPSYEVAKDLALALDIDIAMAIKSAYRSRIERDKQREKEYLIKFLKDNDLPGLDLKKLLK